MRNFLSFQLSFIFALAALIGLTQPAQAATLTQQDSPEDRGKYLATIAGCTSCHTPDRPEFQNPQALTFEQITTLAFDGHQAVDSEKLLAGGRTFDLGPAGVVYSLNITPDEETGIGSWSDEQIKLAIKTGTSADGSVLFPVMPYHVYNGMADEDLNAIVAYLRSVPPVKNVVPERTVNTEGMPVLPYQTGIIAPDPSDLSARGAYLVDHIMGCTDCHTPVDPNTGAPQLDKYLAGRQPYEGPWGIVYGGNITPDEETGIGIWNEEELKRSLLTGVNKDGRRLILMPWYAYSALSPEDTEAVIYYLKNDLPAVHNEIPAPSLNPEFTVILPQQESNIFEDEMKLTSPLVLVAAGVVVMILVTLVMFLFRRKSE